MNSKPILTIFVVMFLLIFTLKANANKETEMLKTLQAGRMVFLCFHKNTSLNMSAIRSDLNAVANNFKGSVSVIYANSGDKENRILAEKFQMNSALPTVFMLVPPGKVMAKLSGFGITKESLMRALVTSCGGGSCGSGCK